MPSIVDDFRLQFKASGFLKNAVVGICRPAYGNVISGTVQPRSARLQELAVAYFSVDTGLADFFKVVEFSAGLEKVTIAGTLPWRMSMNPPLLV